MIFCFCWIHHQVKHHYCTSFRWSLFFSFFFFSPIWIRFQLPQPIDVETPQSARTRKGFDGFDYDLVFSDEFNTPGRTFYPGLLSYFPSFFTFAVLSFHDSTSTFNLTLYILFSPLITPFSSHPFSGSPPFPFPEFTALSFFLLFLDRSWVICHPATYLPGLSGGNSHPTLRKLRFRTITVQKALNT